jgi:DnaD/phage-associated family protein
MSSIRFLQTDFWRDDFFLELSPEDKYFYLYLLTNDVSSQCGIYNFIPKLAAVELGYSEDTVMVLINRFVGYGKIFFNEKNKEVMIINWYKFNLNINNKNTRVCMNTCLKKVKTVAFIRQFYKFCMQKSDNVEFIQEVFKDISMENVDREGLAKERIETVTREMLEENEGKQCSRNITVHTLEIINEEELKNNKFNNQQYKNEQAMEFEQAASDDNFGALENAAGDFNCFDFRDILIVYENTFHKATYQELNYLKDWSKIFSSEVIIYAIEISVKNNKRKIQYLNGILRNWKDQGMKCLQDVKDMEARGRGKEKAEDYDQSSGLRVIDYGEYDPELFKI